MIQNKNNTNSRIFNLVAAIPWFPLPPFSSPSVRNPPCILLSLHVRPNSAICTVFSRLVAQNGGRASILQSRNSRLFSYGLCPSLADHEARDARTSIDCHRNYQRAVALFPYSRVSTTVSRVASQFCRKKQYATTPSPSFPRLSNYLFSHRHLSPSVHTRPHFVSPLPSLSSSPTHTHTHVQTAILRCFHSFTPLYSPCHSSISLCLHLSLPFDHQPRPLFLAHSLSFSRRRGTGTRYVILSMARRNMNASSVRFRLPSSGGGIAQPTLSGNCNHGNAYLCESIGVWRAKRRWMEEEEGDTFRYRRGWIRAAGNEQRRTRAKRGNFRTTFIGNYCFRPGVRGEWLIIAWGYYLLSRPSHDYLSWNARLPSIVHNYGDEKVFRG